MIEFLDPRSDIVFKKIFMDHPAILKSFLNAVLPFKSESEWIATLSVLPAEETPELHILKDTCVDVKCCDASGRYFVVEMQMNWTSAFVYRVLFNASKAYARQLDKSGDYGDLKPVYGLSILDDNFPVKGDLVGGKKLRRGKQHKGKYYHHYRLVHTEDPSRIIDHLQLIFVELPAFRDADPTGAHLLHWAWLRFMSEAGDVGTEKGMTLEQFAKKVLISKELKEAAEIAKVSGYTRAQLEAYDHFWDNVRREKTLMSESYRKGAAEERTKSLERESELLQQKEEALRREEDAIRQKEDALRQREEAFQREKDALQEKDEAKRREKDAVSELAKMRLAMKKAGLEPDKL